jgi:oligoendopeptidase F
MATATTSSAGIRWDLGDLSADAAAADAAWEELLGRARDLAERARGGLASLDAAGLRALLEELDAISERLARVQFYATAREHTEATSEEANDLATAARDRSAELENLLLFADLEWLQLDDARAEELLAAPELAPYAHRLRVEREEKPYVLGEAEEQALNARRPVASAWEALHGRQLATLTVDFDAGEGGEPHTIDRLLAYAYDPRRELRLGAIDALYAGLEPRADVLAAAYDALVGDRLSVDRLRGVPDPMLPTNLRNELDREVVEAMMSAIEEHHPLARRWFARKAGLLGLERLELADQYAPIGESRTVSWDEAASVVEATLTDFAPQLGEVFRTCLERGHVDAEPRPGKVGGAYCNAVSRHVLPYVLMNFTDQMRDVVTLAHEFGHATHGALSQARQAYRSWRVGLAVAEVPSTFVQLLAIERLLEREEEGSTRTALLAGRAEGAMGAIFRQTVLARFEQRAYALRAEGKALTADRLSEVWREQNERYYGDVVALPEGYRLGWSYIPHFIHVRFYTYAYAFAHLVAFSLLRRHRADPEAFAPRYLDFLGAGGSASPQDLLEPLGVDLRDPETWRDAFAEFERAIGEAERGLETLG